MLDDLHCKEKCIYRFLMWPLLCRIILCMSILGQAVNFFLLLPTKIIEIYSVSLSHQRCKWISWKFFFGMVKGNHFTTLTPLWVAFQSLTYHPNLGNALLRSDLASTRADAQLVQRSAWLQFLYLHTLCIWQHLHRKHSRGKSSQVKFFERIDIAGGICVLSCGNEICLNDGTYTLRSKFPYYINIYVVAVYSCFGFHYRLTAIAG